MKRISHILSRVLFIAADIFSICFSYILVLIMATNSYRVMIKSNITLNSIAIAVAVFISIHYVMNTYKSIWIHAGVNEFFNGMLSCFFSVTVISVICIGMHGKVLSIKLQLLSTIIASMLILGIRLLPRLIYYLVNYSKTFSPDASRLLIIGAGEGASTIIRQLYKENKNYSIVGLIDDDKTKTGMMLSGHTVLGTREDILSIVNEHKVNEILLAIPSIDGKNKKAILEICNLTDCKIKILPHTSEMLLAPGEESGKIRMRDVQPEDLLGRDVIYLENEKIKEYIANKTVMVTGGGGSIGSELCRQIALHNPSLLIIFDIYENNAYDLQNELSVTFPDIPLKVLIGSVRDRERLDAVFCEFRPDIIFHAAAHKHVPLMETSPGETIKNNICGTLNVCEAARKYNANRFVLISTDKAVNPTNIMGASKRICEMIVQAIDKTTETDFVAVRFGNVLGSNGSVIPLFKKQIERGGPVTLTHKDITRYFMTIPEAAQLVLEAGAYAQGGEIFVLDMGEPVRIYDLAVNLIKLSGYEVNKDIEIKITGLRPGEKLYEELLMNEEGLTETVNEKIFVARPGEFVFEELKQSIEKLLDISNNDDTFLIKQEIQRMVPEYAAENN